MNNSIRAVSKLIALILGNTAAIGFGIGIYEGKLLYSILAFFITIIACCIEWGSEK